jgi:hypothetical protein
MVWFRGLLIIVLVLLLLLLLLVGLMQSRAKGTASTDAFVPVVPDTRIKTVPSSVGSDAVELNGCWRKILSYLQANPGKAMPFLNFAKANFFNSSCGIRQPRIQFETLADQYQPIFT